MTDRFAWAATALILVAYLIGGVTFDWANALLWPFVALSAWQHRALPSLTITLTFGAIGIFHLVRIA